MQYQGAGTWPIRVENWTVSASGVTNPTGELYQVAVADGGGGAYFAGSVNSSKAIAVAKVGSAGTVEWQKTFTTTLVGPNAAVFSGVLMPNGDVVLQGTINNSGATPNRMFLMRVTSVGTVSAFRSYVYSNSFTYPSGVAADNAGNIYAAMYVSSGGVSHFFAKINPTTLDTVWVNQIQGSSNQNSIGVTPDGSGVYIAGVNSTFGYVYLNRCSPTDGSSVWEARITTVSGSTANTFEGVSVDNNNNVFVVAANYGVAANICKFNSSGVLQWTKGFSTAGTFSAPRTQTDSSGNVYAFMGWTRYYAVYPGFDDSLAIAKLDTSGNTVFSSSTTSNAVTGAYVGVGFDPGSGKVFKVSRYGGNLLYQSLPADGTGYGLYQGGTAYFPYSPGPVFSNGTVSASLTTRSTSAISLATVSDTPTVANTTNSYTSAPVNYPLSSASALYFQPGTYSWIAPAGVTSVSVLCIGGGGGGGGSQNNGFGAAGGGGGGGLAYRNAISVTPGTAYTVVVGVQGNRGLNDGTSGTAGGQSSFNGTATLFANGGGAGGGRNGGQGGGSGGTGGGTSATAFTGGVGASSSNASGGGGGGAAGYAGSGGQGASNNNPASSQSGTPGLGGGGGGGPSGYTVNASEEETYYYGGTSGGGVGVIGQGANGTGAGTTGSPSTPQNFGYGGGGAGFTYNNFSGNVSGEPGQFGGSGAVRILWGAGRSFPTTNVSTP
jgi:hypothetical protein